jgi:acetylornithine deacetylase/succinyl-diaminopimelate desuccinylase-like protein
MVDEAAVKRVVGLIRQDDIVKLTREMIAIPSPNFEEGKLTDFMVERMRELDMEVTTMDVDHPFQKGRKTRQAIGRLKGSGGGPTLMINGHLDVNVEMPGWTVHPTEGKYEDGWIWGLAAQDDKGGLAAALCAVAAIRESGTKLKGDILYCPVASHKLGGTGTRTLVKNGITADYCINIEHAANTIGSVIVGSVRVRLRTSTPGLFFRFTKEARDAYFNPIEQQAMFMAKFGPSLVLVPQGSWLTYTPHKELPNFPMIRYDVVTKDHYGRTCDLVFQIRTVPGMTLASVRKDVERVVEQCKRENPAVDCEIIIPANGPDDPFYMEPTALGDNHPLVAALARGYETATGEKPQIGGVERIGNFGDGNVLHAAGIPSVQFGPGNIKLYPEWPAPDERVHISELMTTARTCAYAIMDLCG